MFVSQHEAAAVAMQEIEVISMDGGEDNVTTRSLPSPPSMNMMATPSPTSTPPAANWIESSPPSSPSSDRATPSQIEQAMDTLLAMTAHEQTLPSIDHRARARIPATPITLSAAGHGAADDDEPVNDHDRTKMCDWYYEMSDFLKIDRSTASRSLTLLDRFMATPVQRLSPSKSSSAAHTVPGVVAAASRNRDEYQLVALTALFLAIKLYERLNIQPEHVSYLSRGRYASAEVVEMEAIVLAALEWRVCMADKADYVEAFLDVLLPRGQSVCVSSAEEASAPILAGLRDLANLQIQLSDFDSSFSTRRRSTVAFAAVINAFEMKKEDLSEVDQHLFLEGVQRVMHKMHPSGNDAREREELATSVKRLRVLVDPPSSSGSIHGTPSINLTPTSYQRYHHQPSSIDGSVRTQRYAHVSPLDVALESMDHFDMSQLFCCGSHQTHAAPDPAFHDVDAGHQDEDRDHDMATEEVGVEDAARLESASSFGSGGEAAAYHEKRGRGGLRSNHSPTSIATILFGK